MRTLAWKFPKAATPQRFQILFSRSGGLGPFDSAIEGVWASFGQHIEGSYSVDVISLSGDTHGQVRAATHVELVHGGART